MRPWVTITAYIYIYIYIYITVIYGMNYDNLCVTSLEFVTRGIINGRFCCSWNFRLLQLLGPWHWSPDVLQRPVSTKPSRWKRLPLPGVFRGCDLATLRAMAKQWLRNDCNSARMTGVYLQFLFWTSRMMITGRNDDYLKYPLVI